MDSLTPYRAVGPLLHDYRKSVVNNRSQKAFAEPIGVSARTLGRWERGESHPRLANLLQISKVTLLPFEVLLRLSHHFVTLYNLRTHRFAYSQYERDFVNKKVVQKELFLHNDQDDAVYNLAADGGLEEILSHKRRIYAPKRHLPAEVVEAGVTGAPAFNWIARGYKGEYAGHLLVLPLGGHGSSGLQSRTLREGALQVEHLVPVETDRLRTIHMYSFYACNSATAYALLRRFVRTLLHNWEHLVRQECTLTRYAVTLDGIELSEKLGLRPVYDEKDEQRDGRTEAIPQFFASPISSLKWLAEYRDAPMPRH